MKIDPSSSLLKLIDLDTSEVIAASIFEHDITDSDGSIRHD